MKKNKQARKENIRLLLFTLPALLLFTIFLVYPFFKGLHYSLHNWDGISPTMEYVGLKNYTKLFTNKKFFSALIFSAKFCIVAVISQNMGALIIANLLDNMRKGRNFFRSVFFIPNVLSGVIVAFLWRFIFAKVLPDLGAKTGWEFLNVSWFSDGNLAFGATVIVAFWLGTGYLTVIYLSGLSTLDQNVVESAQLEGANAWQMLYYIKTPLIFPSIVIGVFMVTMNSLKQFDIVFMLTGGGPYDSTLSLALLSYVTAYSRKNYGQATAQAMIMFLLVMAVTGIELLIMKKREVES